MGLLFALLFSYFIVPDNAKSVFPSMTEEYSRINIIKSAGRLFLNFLHFFILKLNLIYYK